MSSASRPATGYAALERGGPVVPWTFERRALRPTDVALKIRYCGICHTDLHSITKWGQEFPLVPGHEIIGTVIELGSAVSELALGDTVAVGTIVDSCGTCEACVAHEESYCREFPTLTFDGLDRVDGMRTRGGYSDHYVADHKFVYKLPEGLDPAGAAPLLCAGITTFSPLRHWKAGPGSTVGVVGIGGLGHLAVKFARAMGAHVVAFTTSAKKVDTALALGAHEVVLSSDAKQMDAHAYTLDLIIDTVSTAYPLDPMLKTLRRHGTLVSLGIPAKLEFSPILLTLGRRSLSSSGVGGTAQTREMLEFCRTHNLVADVEVIRPSQIATAFERLAANDVRFRFVLDMQHG